MKTLAKLRLLSLPSLPSLLAILLPAAAAIALLVWLIANLPTEEDQRMSRARDDLRALRSVLLLGEMPKTGEGLEALVRRGDIPFLPEDPWGHPYQYRNPGKVYAYDLFSLGADGVESEDDIDVWNLYSPR